ncbi:LAFE_0C05182g1_1 [Lachancea fermentati]|uniref:LAFE_0C05182g1_1 n=1 Tax=Lachancea fermentati TaxID=4955 RepID=A0A1G4M9D9_LACFM|nr:LAFE_0C05182g1_1 [Lachancea fermentati]
MFWSSKSGISSNYSYSSSPTFVVDSWSVHTGRPKSSSTNALAKISVFIFDKKQFENYLLTYGVIKSKSSSKDKLIIQEAYNVLKTQVGNLAKLKHPNILTLIEPLEEHSKNFMFVAEYISGSLDTIFGSDTNEELEFLQNGVNSGNVIIQRGILQISQALEFIHNRASSVLLNLQPQSVLVNDNSDWKVFGLGHLVKLPQGTNTADYFIPQFSREVPAFMHIPLDYSAPELILDKMLSPKNDYFSLGLLIYFLYYKKSLLNCENSISSFGDQYAKFERQVLQYTSNQFFSKIPEKLRFCMPKLMNRDVFNRFDNISDFIESEFFQDPLIKTLIFLDDLPTKNAQEKSIFLDGLDKILPQFPTPLLQRKFLPVLLELMDQSCSADTRDPECLKRNLQVVIQIGSTLSQLTFHEKVYPHLVSDVNFPILLSVATSTFIDNLRILKDKCKSENFINVILKPLCSHVLSSNSAEIAVELQETLLLKLEIMLECFDFPTVKNFLFPLISQLFVKTTSLTVKNSCVGSFEKMIQEKAIDKYICVESILPLFKSMKTRDPRILLKSLQLFRLFPAFVDNENVIVEQLLPLLWNFSIAPSLKPSQYSDYIDVINKISADIQRSHMEKLKESTGLQSQSESANFNKVIEKPIQRREDPDTQAAKSISVPAMQPRTLAANSRSTSSGASTDKIIRQTNLQKPKTMPPTTEVPKRAVRSPPTKPLILTKGVAQNSPKATRARPARIINNQPKNDADDFEDFDDFVSSTSSPISAHHSRFPANAEAKAAVNVQAQSPKVSNTTPSTAFPPGFSMALQPQRKSSPLNSGDVSVSDGPSLL